MNEQANGCNTEAIDQHDWRGVIEDYEHFPMSAANKDSTRSVWACDRCGSLVVNGERHDEWHRSLGWGK